MKRYLFYYIVLLWCMMMSVFDVSAQQISEDEALMIARQFLNGGDTLDRKDTTEQTNNDEISLVCTETSPKDGATSLYAFNRQSGGFVIVAGDERVGNTILGYSYTGKFDTKNMKDNQQWWLDCYCMQIDAIKDDFPEGSSATKQKKNFENIHKASSGGVAPLMEGIKWGQGQRGSINLYFNYLTPTVNGENCLTGCLATAMAQIMRYHRWPERGKGSHSYTWNGKTLRAAFSSSEYQWDLMYPGYTDYQNEAEKGNMEPWKAVARLISDCGISVDMSYGLSSTGGSGTVSSYAVRALRTYFDYEITIAEKIRRNYTDEEWSQILKDELDEGRPILYSGQDPTAGGHAFVCDGYDTAGNFHLKWGWCGQNDGYYAMQAEPVDTSHKLHGRKSFSEGQEAIIGIQKADDTKWTAWRNYDTGVFTTGLFTYPVSWKENIDVRLSKDGRYWELRITDWGKNCPEQGLFNGAEMHIIIDNKYKTVFVPVFEPNSSLCDFVADLETSPFGQDYDKSNYSSSYDEVAKILKLGLAYYIYKDDGRISWYFGNETLTLPADFDSFATECH